MKEARIPTILGLVLMIAVTAAAGYFLNRNTSFLSKASGDCLPKSMQITNITDKSFDVSFSTTDSCLATLSVSGQIFNDSRQSNAASVLHYFSITDLAPATPYNFTVIGGSKNYTSVTYKATTATTPSAAIPSAKLAWGKVLTSDNLPAAKAVLYLTIPGASPLSAFVTDSGNWNIPLASSFNSAKTDWFTPSDQTDESISVISESGLSSNISWTTDQNNPVPDIIIGQNSLTSNIVSTTPTVAVSQLNLGLGTTTSALTKSLAVNSPKEGEFVNSTQPSILGTGPAGKTLTLTLTSSAKTTTAKVTVPTSGNWTWSVPSVLSTGSKTLVVQIDGSQLAADKITRQFYVTTDSSLPAFVSTPSATLVPTAVVLTSTPTLAPTPTSTPVIRKTRPSTESGVPVTGFSAPTFLVGGVSLLLILASLLFIF